MSVTVPPCATTQRKPLYTLRVIPGGISTALRQDSAEPARTTPAKLTKRAVAWIRGELGHHRAIGDLATLDNHILADVGLNRDIVDHVVRFGRVPKGWW